MKHKVRLTVIDKKLYPELQNSTALIRIPEYVHATTWAMSLNSIVMVTEMISGIAVTGYGYFAFAVIAGDSFLP